jgi:glycosyltransferase involved in cell wall biosynthesis
VVAQKSRRNLEIIVVDNNPTSTLTPPVVAEFPGVVLVEEQRRGSSYARNKGIVNSTGEIVITADDDVTMGPEWLEKLVAPFAQSEVMAVTGNVLPVKMETIAQKVFESYGGLGRGFEYREYAREWFESFKFGAVRTWELGATANAAFRSIIFSDPSIGLMDEALGSGMPSGCSEDTYLFYKILKADYRLAYEPAAYVWHKHRQDLQGLRRQIYNYSKGHVAYHLTTFLRDHDLRALFRLIAGLPRAHLGRIVRRVLGQSDYPLGLIFIEILGNIIGAYALWKSRRRVKREGQSKPYIPVEQRATALGAIAEEN